MSDFYKSDGGFKQVGCRIFDKSDVGCRILKSRMSDFYKSDVECRIFKVGCRMAPISFRTLRLAGTARQEPFTYGKAIPPNRVPRASRPVTRVGGLPGLACKRFNEFSKETCEKLALPE